MPLPPVEPWSDIGSSSGSPLKNVLSRVMAFMEIRNRGSHMRRIENIPAALKKEIQEWGYTVIPKYSDYLYRTADLIHPVDPAFQQGLRLSDIPSHSATFPSA